MRNNIKLIYQVDNLFDCWFNQYIDNVHRSVTNITFGLAFDQSIKRLKEDLSFIEYN